jgi:hypothetical protein
MLTLHRRDLLLVLVLVSLRSTGRDAMSPDDPVFDESDFAHGSGRSPSDCNCEECDREHLRVTGHHSWCDMIHDGNRQCSCGVEQSQPQTPDVGPHAKPVQDGEELCP